jgi:hypothetical protein
VTQARRTRRGFGILTHALDEDSFDHRDWNHAPGAYLIQSAQGGAAFRLDVAPGAQAEMTLVVIPSSQPSTEATRMIQTSEAWLVLTTQLSFTWRVFGTASEITITRSAISAKAQV